MTHSPDSDTGQTHADGLSEWLNARQPILINDPPHDQERIWI